MDRQAAIAGRRNRLPVSLSGLVTQALNLFDPEIAEGLEEAALAHREVVFDYTGTESIGTARLTATLDTLDAPRPGRRGVRPGHVDGSAR